MEAHPQLLVSEGVQRKNGQVTAFGAGDAVAAVVDILRLSGVPLAPQIKARLGKGAKGLLEAGFSPELVVVACVTAVRTCWFGSVETIAQEIAVAASGGRQTRGEYGIALAETSEQLKRADSRVWVTMREELARRQRAETRGLMR